MTPVDIPEVSVSNLPNTPTLINETVQQPQLPRNWNSKLIMVGAVLVLLVLALLLRGPLMNFFEPTHGLGALPPASLSPTLAPQPDIQSGTESLENTSLPTPQQTAKDDVYTMNVLVLSYFPLTADGQSIDLQVTGDWGESYQSTLQKTRDQTKNLQNALEKGTKYLGYKNTTAPSGLKYKVIDTKEYTQAVPMLLDGSRKPNYSKILLDHNICNLVDTKNITEVWLWAYQGPSYPGTSVPYLNISESKMSGPNGDISNSYRENNMPVCSKTYRVYTFNYQRGTAEALHSWGHQLESEMDAISTPFFRNVWQKTGPAATQNRTGGCGDVHHPPNAIADYDYKNATPHASDCFDWSASGTQKVTDISCKNWGCGDVSDSNNAHINYLVWNMQNIPGKDNGLSYGGQQLINWWEIHADFDKAMKERSFFVK